MSACLADRGRLRGQRPRGGPAAAPAAVLRRVDREPRAARLPAARARLPRLRRRDRDGGRPPRGRRARAAAEEGRQRADDPGRSVAPCTRSTSRSAASTGCPPVPSWPRLRPHARRVRSTTPWPRSRWRPASTSRTSSRTTSTSRSAPRRDYPIEAGTFVTSSGRRLPGRATSPTGSPRSTSQHSNALHAQAARTAGPYVVGPLARYSLNHDRLPPIARQAADAAGLGADLPQPVPLDRRACRRARGGLRGGAADHRRLVRRRRAVGAGPAASRSRARRDRGTARRALPPLRAGAGRHRPGRPRSSRRRRRTWPASRPTSAASSQTRMRPRRRGADPQCEQAIRNYDPCISCATHFLDLTVEET